MAVAKRVTGKYGVRPKGSLTLMSKIVQDKDYKLHGQRTPVYMYFFLRDEEGKNFGISKDGKTIVDRQDMEDWDRKIMEDIDREHGNGIKR